MSAPPASLPRPVNSIQDLMARLMLRDQLLPEESAELEGILRQAEYAPGTLILQEGARNERLYYLVEGKVAIVKGGEKIATLSTPGDLLGEMSLITGKPCSASSVAETQVIVLALEPGEVTKLSPRLQELLTTALYRLFAIILVEKLNATNEKARLFEVSARELSQAKRALETASRNRIDELTGNQRGLFARLGKVLTAELGPIQAELGQVPATAGDFLSRLTERIARVARELESLARSFDTDQPLAARRVLLAEDQIDAQIDAKMSLGGTGLDLTVAGDLEAGRAALQVGKFDVICLNEHFIELIPLARATNPESRLVFMTSQAVSEHFSTLRAHPELTTLIARHPDDRAFTLRNTSTTIRKLSTGDIFGMEKYLAWGTEIHEAPVERSDKRRELIEGMIEYFQGLGIRGALVRRCERVAEELLMNILYDAPCDAQGKSLYNHLDRATEITLAPEQRGTFRFACDGSFLAIAVEDPFGSLTRSTILNYLERCYAQGIAGPTPEQKGGGGNGLFQIIQSSSLVVFNVRPRAKTEVIALFNINIQINKLSVHPSFHFFETM